MKKLILALLGLVFLSACTTDNGQPAQLGALHDAVYHGYIMCMEIAIQDAEQHGPETIMPRIGSLYSTTNISVSAFFANEEWLNFERMQGYATFAVVDDRWSLYVENGTVVQEGDILAFLTYNDGRSPIYRDDAARRLREFDHSTANERNRRLDEIANAQIALDAACDETWPQLALRLEQLELAYERFSFNSQNARYPLAQAFERLNAEVVAEYLIAPFDGVITAAFPRQFRDILLSEAPWRYRIYEPLDIAHVRLSQWPGVFRISTLDEFLFFARVNSSSFTGTPTPHANILRYGEIVTMHGRHADSSPMRPIYAQVISDPWSAGSRDNLLFWFMPLDIDGFLEYMRERDPYGYLMALSRITFSIPQSIAIVDNGILLPTTAIHRQDAQRFVFVYEMGSVTKRYVVTGPTQGLYTQILSGIELDTKVVLDR